MIPLNGLTVTAGGVLLVIAGLTIAYLLIDRHHEREGAALFTSALPAETWPAEMPEPRPFPGEVPFLPAPVTAPLHPSAVLTREEAAQIRDPADDTLWRMCRIEPGPAVWERLALEGVNSNG